MILAEDVVGDKVYDNLHCGAVGALYKAPEFLHPAADVGGKFSRDVKVVADGVGTSRLPFNQVGIGGLYAREYGFGGVGYNAGVPHRPHFKIAVQSFEVFCGDVVEFAAAVALEGSARFPIPLSEHAGEHLI